jgi:RNA polymerase sigma factor (sigma-70 family)
MNQNRITHIEEIELVRQFQETGDKRSLDKIVLGNLGLVHKIVGRFPIKNASCSYDDLFQEGVAGLIHGIRKFDTKRGYRLSTYSYNWIAAYVRRAFQNTSRNVRIPVHMSDKQLQLNKMIEKMTNDLGRTPTADEIRTLRSDVDTIMTSMVNCVSLNAIVGDSSELEELVGGVDNTEEFESTVDCEILLQRLRDEVSTRDYNILIKRFGLDGSGERTLSELAEEFDITRSRCHQIEGHLLQQLRTLV